jgi:signal transduction histidine kinase/CHASE2 domain-containing sensor protein
MLRLPPKRATLYPAVLIVVVSAAFGMLVDWRAPGINRYAKDWLMRERGPLPVPSDIAIVAIDEKSMATFGRFPWSRQVLAKTIDALSGYGPKVIAVDVLFPDPTNQGDDEALARSIGHAGNVVLAAQLIDSSVQGGAAWLRPLPELAGAAAGVGHVNVQVESEDVARQIAVQMSDDAGQTLRSIAVEAVRVAERVPPAGIAFTGNSLLLGERVIPLERSPASVVIGQDGSRSASILPTGRMSIDYIGPAGAFGPVTYSVSDILSGAVHAGAFQSKCVLIGATGAGQGDRMASPFVHQTDAHLDQHGALMPGVEVLANAVNTVLRSRFYSDSSDWSAFFWAALVAALTLGALQLSQGWPELVRQVAALCLLGTAVVTVGYFVFARFLIFPPLVPALCSLTSAGILGLLARNLGASARLDRSIAELSQSAGILPSPGGLVIQPQPNWLPHGLEWKVQRAAELNAQLIARAKFVDMALKSVEDGLLIATPEGMISFANRRAGQILEAAPEALTGQDLLKRLGISEQDLLRRMVVERASLERELEMRGTHPRRYVLRMAAVAASDSAGSPVCGIVASLSDVTRQYELQQTKNDVIALVSHEMRTPLTAIQGMTELLANYEIDSPRRKEISVAINHEVKRLASMISEYLDITRLESGATVVRKTPARVEAVLQRVVLLLEPVAGQRRIRLSMSVPDALPALLVDVDLLGRAVENLVSNAIKYSPTGTDVQVKAVREHHELLISVEDHGYGIPEVDLDRVFNKFYRVPRVEDAGVPGTGLGLAFVREIAELHGGAVSVTSKVNQGSTFTLRIPLREEIHPDSTLGE